MNSIRAPTKKSHSKNSKRYYPSTKPLGKNTFIKEVKMFVNDPKNNSEFEWTNSTRSRDRMMA